jgi:hypothetical protein
VHEGSETNIQYESDQCFRLGASHDQNPGRPETRFEMAFKARHVLPLYLPVVLHELNNITARNREPSQTALDGDVQYVQVFEGGAARTSGVERRRCYWMLGWYVWRSIIFGKVYFALRG